MTDQVSIDSLRREQLRHIENLMQRYRELESLIETEKYGHAAAEQAFCIRAAKAIHSIDGHEGVYTKQAEEHLSWFGAGYQPLVIAEYMHTLLVELRTEIELGPLDSVSELIRGQVFADYLSMAGHLLEEGYKDAAAVIAGSTLENHLRQLSIKHGLPVEKENGGGFIKADVLNSSLAKTAYSKFDQKQVTGWLDLRNNAAHGHYDAYTASNVGLFIEWLADFIERNPA